MAYHDTIARLGDSDNTLLGKILQRLGGLATFASSDNDLLFKILTSLNGVDLTSEQALFDARYVLKAGDTMTGGLTVPSLISSDGITAVNTITGLNLVSTGAVGFGSPVVATIQCTIQDALTSTLLFINNTNAAGSAGIILRNTGIAANRGWRITSDGGTDQLSIQDEGVGIMAIFTAAKNLVLHTASTVQPTSLAKGLVLADGTAATADPTTASAIWSIGGSLQYRTSGASEGSGQTNSIHNRAAEQAGVGTNYNLTASTAHVVFGTTNADITLPTAGTYLVEANVSFTGSTAGDEMDAKLRNSTDATDIGATKKMNSPTGARCNIFLSEIVTITASKAVQIFAFNATAVRGAVESTTTDIRYVRLF